MDTDQAARLARQLMDEHGLTDWRFRLSHARHYFGLAYSHRKLITLSASAVELNSEAVVRNTILHEIAHALAPVDAHHGTEWKRIAVSIGCTPERCVHDSAVKPPSRYISFCRNCGKVSEHNCDRGSACGKCCNALNRGKYSPKYRLIVRTRTEVETAGGIEAVKKEWRNEYGEGRQWFNHGEEQQNEQRS